MTEQILTYLFTTIGLIGFALARKKIWWCWYVNIINQVLWVAFALITGYYALIVGSIFYFTVFGFNAYEWTKEHFKPWDLNEYNTVPPHNDVQVRFDVNADQYQAQLRRAQEELPNVELKFKDD